MILIVLMIHCDDDGRPKDQEHDQEQEYY